MKATITLEIEVPDKISGKIVTQKEISKSITDCIEKGVDDARHLEPDFGCREIFISSRIKVISAQTNTLIQ